MPSLTDLKKKKRIQDLYHRAFMAAIAESTPSSVAPSSSRMPFVKKKRPGIETLTNVSSEGSSDTNREKLQVMLECPHCGNQYSDPYILQCQHSVCKECADEIVEDAKQRETEESEDVDEESRVERKDVGHDSVECPVCTEHTPLAEAKPDLNKQQLIALLNEEDSGKLNNDSDDSDFEDGEENMDKIPHCEVCTKPIQWHCIECNQWMCNECKSKHVKFKATKSHKLDHIVAVSREHRSRLEKTYKDILRAEEKLHTIINQSEREIKNTQEQEATALKESNASRQEWLRQLNERFDAVDVKITDFVSNRVQDLQQLKSRSEELLLDLAEKTAFLSGFLTKQPPILVTKGGKISSDMDQYLSLTTIPRVEFKETLINFKRGTKFEPKAVANYELKGGHSQVNIPILLKNILKHSDQEVVAPLPAPKDQHKKVPLPKSKAADSRVKTDGTGEVRAESHGISNIIIRERENGGNIGGPQEKKIVPRSQRNSSVVRHITRDSNYEDIGRLTPRVTPAPGNTSRSRLSRRTPVPNPKALTFDLLRQLMKLRYHLNAVITLTTKPVSIRHIHGNIWCCQGDTVTIWSTDLEEVHTVSHGMLKQVQSMALLKSGNVALATGAGLHLLGPEGQYNGRVSDECYMDVDTCESYLYAVLYGAVTRCKMHIYDEDKGWDILRTVVLPSDGLVTVNASSLEGMLYVCSHDHGVVYVTTANGEVIRRCGRKGVYGGPGYFNKPRICHGDLEGSLLIADKRNQCLQVHNIDGDWTLVNLEEKPDRPCCAVFAHRQLFVLQSENSWKLMKYTT